MIKAFRGDITTVSVDAIVNAANERLAMGGGVCGAIFRAAGERDISAACAPLAPCPTGEARIAPGFALKARHGIHAVGPVSYGGDRDEAAQLAGCYRGALALLRQAGGRSIAFPAISTGIHGYPLHRATPLAIATVRDELAANGPLDVTFICFDDHTLSYYQEEIAQ